MPIGIQGKLNELNNFQRTDGSIQVEYNQVTNRYSQSKKIYKSSKEEYKNAQYQLDNAKENFRNAPWFKMFSANRQVKLAKKNLKEKKRKYNAAKEHINKD